MVERAVSPCWVTKEGREVRGLGSSTADQVSGKVCRLCPASPCHPGTSHLQTKDLVVSQAYSGLGSEALLAEEGDTDGLCL